MSKNYKIVLAVNLILVLLFFTFSVIQKETLIGEGTEVLLRLAPVDPRSLMQGDRVAEFVRLQSGKNVNDGELIIRYKRDLGRLTIGADNYFFQEGSAKKYEKAKYGLLKVDSDGNSILVGLCNKDGRLIE